MSTTILTKTTQPKIQQNKHDTKGEKGNKDDRDSIGLMSFKTEWDTY